MIQSQCHLNGIVNRIFNAELASLNNQITNRLTTGVLVGNEIKPILSACIKDSGNVVVIQLSTGAGFVTKPGNHRRILGRPRMQNLQRHITSQFQIRGLENGPHSSGTQPRSNLKMGEANSGLITVELTNRWKQPLSIGLTDRGHLITRVDARLFGNGYHRPFVFGHERTLGQRHMGRCRQLLWQVGGVVLRHNSPSSTALQSSNSAATVTTPIRVILAPPVHRVKVCQNIRSGVSQKSTQRDP